MKINAGNATAKCQITPVGLYTGGAIGLLALIGRLSLFRKSVNDLLAMTFF